MLRPILETVFGAAVKTLNSAVPWHKLPPHLGVINLIAYRDELRAKNLHTTEVVPKRPVADSAAAIAAGCTPREVQFRSVLGTCNSLESPAMGRAGARFGRNVPLQDAWPETGEALLTPSPRVVSRRLLARDEFKPATTLNLLAAAWIQYMVHDWFNHGMNEVEDPFRIPLEPDDAWDERRVMEIRRTRHDTTRDPSDPKDTKYPPTYQNAVSHWWDASAIYGCDDETCAKVRSFADGKLRVDEQRRLPLDPETGLSITGFTDNWWVGLGLLHTLFALEHNAICDRLGREYPTWDDEQRYQTARLVNSALMAKIHTVEWTPAILAHPTLQIAMAANWWGLATEQVHKLVGRISDNEVISGIPGSAVDHHGAPFALTEEFASVYRLHPLIPDELQIRSLRTGRVIKTLPLTETLGPKAATVVDGLTSVVDVLYSFGTSHPGAITLHNFPNFLRDLVVPDTRDRIDLAAVDITRDRERGVPRYNRFRELIHKPRAQDFSDITSNARWQQELRDVYGDVDRVDLLVGMLAEDLPDGFGFSDTAFRIFILMASRRLKSDRFFTTDFNARVYTQVGLDWIAKHTMSSVLLRHYPELRPALSQVKNAFAPWPKVVP
jgi:hypothetical protein